METFNPGDRIKVILWPCYYEGITGTITDVSMDGSLWVEMDWEEPNTFLETVFQPYEVERV